MFWYNLLPCILSSKLILISYSYSQANAKKPSSLWNIKQNFISIKTVAKIVATTGALKQQITTHLFSSDRTKLKSLSRSFSLLIQIWMNPRSKRVNYERAFDRGPAARPETGQLTAHCPLPLPRSFIFVTRARGNFYSQWWLSGWKQCRPVTQRCRNKNTKPSHCFVVFCLFMSCCLLVCLFIFIYFKERYQMIKLLINMVALWSFEQDDVLIE